MSQSQSHLLMQEQPFSKFVDILPQMNSSLSNVADFSSASTASPCSGSPSMTPVLSNSYETEDQNLFLALQSRLSQEESDPTKTLSKAASQKDLNKISRTIYIADLDRQITEQQLRALFLTCGPIVDCRVCGDPNCATRFAFVEYYNEADAFKALSYTGTILGSYPIRASPSKTPIVPLNNELLPKSELERQAVARTVYISNIHRAIEHAVLKAFFQTTCGAISKIRLLGDNQHETKIAFIEFVSLESAVRALGLSGSMLGQLPIRVTPSKTPVKVDAGRRNSLSRLSNGSAYLSNRSSATIAASPPLSSPFMSRLSTGNEMDYEQQYVSTMAVRASAPTPMTSSSFEMYAPVVMDTSMMTTTSHDTAHAVASLTAPNGVNVDIDALRLAAAFAASHGAQHPELPQLLVDLLKSR